MNMVRFARMCFDWKVLVALAGVGVLIWITAPDLVLRVLPLLLLAACPISMLLMMRGMQQGHAHHTQANSKSGPIPSGQDVDATVEELEARIKALEGEISGVKAEFGASGMPDDRRKNK